MQLFEMHRCSMLQHPIECIRIVMRPRDAYGELVQLNSAQIFYIL
jgi:hypothetical protein